MAAIPDLTVFAPHTQAKAAEVDANFAALLAVIDPSAGPTAGIDGLNMRHGSSGQLWIADSTGVYQRKTMTGDASINAAGALTIADGAGSSRKLAPAAGVKKQTGGALNLGDTAIHDIPGTTLTITPAVDSLLLCFASFDLDYIEVSNINLANGLQGYLAVDGVRQTEPISNGPIIAQHNATTSTAESYGTHSRSFAVPLDDTAHTLKLQAKVLSPLSGGAGFSVQFATLVYLLFAT